MLPSSSKAHLLAGFRSGVQKRLREGQLHHHVVGFELLQPFQAGNRILPALLTLIDLHQAQQYAAEIRAHMRGHLVCDGETHGGGDTVIGEVAAQTPVLLGGRHQVVRSLDQPLLLERQESG